jgi:hypothetical protein
MAEVAIPQIDQQGYAGLSQIMHPYLFNTSLLCYLIKLLVKCRFSEAKFDH